MPHKVTVSLTRLTDQVADFLSEVPVKMRYSLTEMCNILAITPPTMRYWSSALGILPRCRHQESHPVRYYHRPHLEKLSYARFLAREHGLPFATIKEIINNHLEISAERR